MTDLDVGLLFIFAVTSLGIYGIALGGWASNSKYPLMGAMRSSAQMISYELSLTLSVVGVLMIANTLSLRELVISQQSSWFGFIPRWNIFLQPIAFIVYVISGVAETNRLPFDLAESEQELVAGWHTEYSSMKFALYFLGEYAAMITGSAVIVTLFFGGWHLPGIPDGSHGWIFGLINIAVFFTKVAIVILFFMWVRWTLPRFRYDQLMRLGWLFFFEIALVNIFVVAGIMALLPG